MMVNDLIVRGADGILKPTIVLVELAGELLALYLIQVYGLVNRLVYLCCGVSEIMHHHIKENLGPLELIS